MNRRFGSPSRSNPFCKVLDEAKEGPRFYGLAHKGYGAGFFGFLRNVATSRHYHGWNVGKNWVLASLCEKSPAIEYRHFQVQKNQCWTSLRVGKQPKRFTSIRRALDRMALSRQELCERLR